MYSLWTIIPTGQITFSYGVMLICHTDYQENLNIALHVRNVADPRVRPWIPIVHKEPNGLWVPFVPCAHSQIYRPVKAPLCSYCNDK